MFDGVKSLQELNAVRRNAISQGEDVVKVNAEYNRAKRVLLSNKPAFKKPPMFPLNAKQQRLWFPVPMERKSEQPLSCITIDKTVVYI